MCKGIPFVDFFSYEGMTAENMRPYLEAMAAEGGHLMTLSSDMLNVLVEQPMEIADFHHVFDEFGMTCRCAHALWRDGAEMSLPFEGDRKRMIARISRTLELAAEFGADTLAIHGSTWVWENTEFDPRVVSRPIEKWREYMRASIGELLPVAERNGICIALENTWGPLDTPVEVARFAEEADSPYFGLCFDSGHANVMAASGLRSCEWLPGIWKPFGEIQWTDNALDVMLPYVVTAHLHDNNTETDRHDLPGTGNINWKTLVPKLMSAPRLRSLQNEVSTAHGYSVKAIRNSFKAVLPSECF